MIIQEVGDESKLAQSFQRIRDLVRKRREQRQNENNSRLEQIVREVMQRHAEEEALKAGEYQIEKFSLFVKKNSENNSRTSTGLYKSIIKGDDTYQEFRFLKA